MSEQPEVSNPRDAAFKLIEELIEKMDYLGTGSSSRAAAAEQREDEARLAAIKAAFAAEAPATTKLFCLGASSGEYDDYRNWEVAVYRNYDDAMHDAEAAPKQAAKYAKAYKKLDRAHWKAVEKLQRTAHKEEWPKEKFQEAFGNLIEAFDAGKVRLISEICTIDPAAATSSDDSISYNVWEIELR